VSHDDLEQDRKRYEQASKAGDPEDARTTIAKKLILKPYQREQFLARARPLG